MAQAFPDGFATMVDGLDQAEDLGNALHRKQRVGITSAVGRAVVAVDRNAELVCGHVGQCGNVIGNFAEADQGAHFVEDRLQQRLHSLSCHLCLNQ